MHDPIRLAVLVSGGGSTLQNFIDRIDDGSLSANIALVISSNPQAFGIERARRCGLPVAVVRREDFDSVTRFSDALFEQIRSVQADLVTLAGFLKKIQVPADFMGRVLNIHPALIPSFCGSGYYGRRVHQAVLDSGVKVSGCTVHFVDDEYDHGPIILQRCVAVLDDDTVASLASRVFEQECDAYPDAVRLLAQGRLTIAGRRVRVAD